MTARLWRDVSYAARFRLRHTAFSRLREAFQNGNLAGSSDYARAACILMPGMGYDDASFMAFCLGIDVSTACRYRSAYLHGALMNLSKTVTRTIRGFFAAISCRPCGKNDTNMRMPMPKA